MKQATRIDTTYCPHQAPHVTTYENCGELPRGKDNRILGMHLGILYTQPRTQGNGPQRRRHRFLSTHLLGTRNKTREPSYVRTSEFDNIIAGVDSRGEKEKSPSQ